MKKMLMLLLMMSVSTQMVQAGVYHYLTFERTDGEKVSIDVSSLTLAIDGNTLTAGSESFMIGDLVKMYFSASDETTVTGIDTYLLEEAAEIYDLKGNRVSKLQAKDGVYVVKTKDGNYKLVKK
ncbi:MAG: hypothetical protein IJ290_03970 [Bacteroidaceae bacterium]|nr:hypothetical protein [Bacteroidaceae bacterium]